MSAAQKNKLSKIKIYDYMVKKYPNDPYCKKTRKDRTLADVFKAISTGEDAYKTIGYEGPNSATLKEMVLQALADEMGVSIKAINDLEHENFIPSWGLD